MNVVKYSASFAIVALALSVNALAKDNNSGKFTISDPVQVGSTQLAPGDYKAEWSGPANDVKIDITQHGKTVATTKGRIESSPKPFRSNAVLTKTLQDNTQQLDEIEFANRSEALVLGGE
jgi:hypothetical protein